MIAVRLAILLAACILVPLALSESSTTDIEDGNHDVNEAIGYMNNVLDEYRRHINPRLNADINVSQNQDMYKMWKRNADIINTLLGFPRRLFMAGR